MGQAKTSCLIGNAYIPPGIEPSLRRNISTIGSDRCAFGTAWDPAHAGLPTMAGNTTRTERNKTREPNYNKPYLGTVAILAQGTHRGDALCAALFLRCLFEYLSITHITVLHPHAVIYYLHRGSAPSRCHIPPTPRFCMPIRGFIANHDEVLGQITEPATVRLCGRKQKRIHTLKQPELVP